ncbi:hypothetical protein P4200_32175 [Pseudomonas aeruginosa]|nr:hypothetical protein [Pseudomonas aeruginosa]
MTTLADIPLSMLDLVPVRTGGSVAEALHNSWTWRAMWSAWASTVSGWPSTTTWMASPAPPPRC